jgi:hypothetical protein
MATARQLAILDVVPVTAHPFCESPGRRPSQRTTVQELVYREPPILQQADRDVKMRDNRRDIDGCEATVRTRTSWFRARRGTSSTTSQCVWTGGLEPPTPAPEAGALLLRHDPGGTDGRIRTDTDGGLSAVPLPVGLRQRACVGGPRGLEPTPFSVQGSCASCCATGPVVVAGAGIEPACKAYETSLISDLPHCGGVTGRTRTGFLRGHIPACRPLQLRPQSTREESNLRHPLCERGGLPLTYSSLSGRASWSRPTSSRVISAVPSPSGSRPLCRRGRSRTSSRLRVVQVRRRCATRRRRSQERSNLLLPGFDRPLHRQSFRTVGLLENRAIEGAPPCGHSHDR